MKTIKSFEILEEAGISIRDFEWENDTETYLKFISGKLWSNKDEILVEFEKELKQYPISCLKNIIHVEGTTAEAIAKMQNHAKENLIQSYNDEKDWELQNKIAYGLSMCSSMPHCLIALCDPNLSNQQRNEVWKKVIDRWRKESSDNHKSINISHFRDALKARDENKRKHGSDSDRQNKNALFFARKHRKEPSSQNALKSVCNDITNFIYPLIVNLVSRV